MVTEFSMPVKLRDHCTILICNITERLFLNVSFVTVELQAGDAILVKPRTAVVIKCTLQSSPIHWYKNGKHITTGTYYHVDEQNHTLTINKAGILYCCIPGILASSSHYVVYVVLGILM